MRERVVELSQLAHHVVMSRVVSAEELKVGDVMHFPMAVGEVRPVRVRLAVITRRQHGFKVTGYRTDANYQPPPESTWSTGVSFGSNVVIDDDDEQTNVT